MFSLNRRLHVWISQKIKTYFVELLFLSFLRGQLQNYDTM